jgi:hypothetical protein
MLEKVAMATKWSSERRQVWENKGTAACEDALKLTDEALDRAKKQETAETHLKILENG